MGKNRVASRAQSPKSNSGTGGGPSWKETKEDAILEIKMMFLFHCVLGEKETQQIPAWGHGSKVFSTAPQAMFLL